LQESIFHYTQLRKANLREAMLQGADLRWAHLQSADLTKAQLQGSDLSETNLQGAYLFQAELQAATLHGTELQGAFLSSAGLQGADLSEAHLQGSDFGDADMQEALLNGAKLLGAFLRGARLQKADFSSATLRGADLSGAKLLGTFMPTSPAALAGILVNNSVDTTTTSNPNWDALIAKMDGRCQSNRVRSRMENAKNRAIELQKSFTEQALLKSNESMFIESNKELALTNSYIAERFMEKGLSLEINSPYSIIAKHIQKNLSYSMKVEIRTRGKGELLDWKYDR
jgi:uncharacterized protein YjbI with pentapeptide repeats